MSNETMFETAGRLFFSRERIRGLEKELSTAGVNIPSDSFAGYVSINVIVVTIFLTAIVLLYQPAAEFLSSAAAGVPFPAVALAVLIGSFIAVYLATTMLISSYLLMKADNRRNQLEGVLPDFLTLVASNIKAGMTLDQAMWYSAKPEFGLLAKEVRTVIKSSFSGESLESTLDFLSSRFDSKVFKRTILLLKQASATGGELTEVLERTADDVRNTIIMKKEIAATLMLYEIFILFAAIIGTPFLFVVASRFIEMFQKIGPQAGSIPTGGAGSVFPALAGRTSIGAVISASDFFIFSIATIVVTSLISSFIVSVVRTGSRGQGMKYFPFVLIASFIFYWLTMLLVDWIFGAIAII